MNTVGFNWEGTVLASGIYLDVWPVIIYFLTRFHKKKIFFFQVPLTRPYYYGIVGSNSVNSIFISLVKLIFSRFSIIHFSDQIRAFLFRLLKNQKIV